jgi:hypothetical protein
MRIKIQMQLSQDFPDLLKDEVKNHAFRSAADPVC